MKLKIHMTLLTLAVTFAVLSQVVRAQAPEEHCRVLLGYKSLQLLQHRFSHDTHPDDSWLPDGDVPGSAGTTDVGRWQDFFAFGLGYQTRFSSAILFTCDGGFLLGGKRDRHQNANDDRDPAHGAFIYTDVYGGAFVTTGVSYYIKRVFVGIEAQLASVVVDNGWDRYSHDQSQNMRLSNQFSAGPKVGYSGGDLLSIEGTVQFNQAVAFSVQMVLRF